MRKLSLVLGILVLAVCVAVPLPAMDLRLPFSAHMLRHTALLLLAAPLLAMAIPERKPGFQRLAALSRVTARYPFVAWFAGILVMWVWHVPGLYNATSGSAAGILSCAPLSPTAFSHVTVASAVPWISMALVVPLLHDLTLLAAGFLFCWPVITPYAGSRLPALRAVLYLATACVCCSLLGLLITFAPVGTYRGIGLTDQQTGGMIMWIPCCFVYLAASMAILIHWLSDRERTAPILAHNK